MCTPVVAIVGYSNSGKTEVACSLVRSLTDAGHKVAAVKHCPHGHDLDRAGSDTDRLAGAGATITVACSPGKVTRVEQVDEEPPLQSIVDAFGDDVDLVIAEGFKHSSVPKVLVANGGGQAPQVSNVVAVVGDRPRDCGAPVYCHDELEDLTAYLSDRFLEGREREASVTVTVDGRPVPLKQFPTEALAGVLKGFVSSLSGLPESLTDIQVRVITGSADQNRNNIADVGVNGTASVATPKLV